METSTKEMEVYWKNQLLYSLHDKLIYISFFWDNNRTSLGFGKGKKRVTDDWRYIYKTTVESLSSDGRGWSGHYLQGSDLVKQSEAGAFSLR